ncbi:chemotaxis protein CheW [Kineosporia sp. NBRC 101731]|uniref:chemotaxis protein CheW n=1 Tax=Kineosporia sp. NBRC 101731 TaxID=3032199 RepID=UPI0024A05498|nr:chemotaxis protein CheW [Kineosporia sp. NBRC 101731]GLY26980.1 ATPase [Kineosporia sp. NBRC 101731]
MEAIDEIVAEFLVESHENLDQLDTDLLALEQDPTSRDLLGSVFRTIHTIKGTSGFLAFNKLEKLTHVGENLLSRMRDGKILLNEDRTSALLDMVDAVRGLLSNIEASGGEGDVDHTELVARLGDLLEDGVIEAPPLIPAQAGSPEAATGAAEAVAGAEDSTEAVVEAAAQAAAAQAIEAAHELAEAAKSHPEEIPVGAQVVSAEVSITNLPEPPAAAAPPPPAPAPKPAEKPAAKAVPEPGEPGEQKRSVVESSVRVDIGLLDTLMSMVGELVLSRNALVSELDEQNDSALARSAQRLSLITSELQEQVMKTRMQPVDTVWSKLPRVVRDLSHQLSRNVRLEMEGRDTELDRSVLEAIKDPMTHLVRNAIDHGIEPPDVRIGKGKNPEGVLMLRAYHEAGLVHLEIIDDGAGIDHNVVGNKAVERGLVTQAQLEKMTPREITQMIFLPGFSTAAKVTNVSGRGVGMDVVKTRIEAIGGSVDVVSNKGAGSTFRLSIPLTLAIIPALTIGCYGHRYAVPQVSVLELVRLSGEHARGGIEHISGAPVYRLRGSLLPLVQLDEQLELVSIGTSSGGGRNDDGRGGFIVVLQAEQHRFGLVVDDVLDTQEIVVKPLGRHLKALPMYQGATIHGDGSVVLILDATAIARRADVLSNQAAAASSSVMEETTPIDPVLVVELSGGRRTAIPLDMVTRLEEIPNETIERVGGREVVQYRGHIMPLVRLANLLGAYGEETDNARVQLVVYTRGQRSVGFAVERIMDIATERAGSRSDIDDHALLGSIVVGDRVVELLDVQAAVLAADPAFYQDDAGATTVQQLGDMYEEAL